MKTRLKKQIQTRLHRIQGQLAGLSRLVERDTYCIDVITQTHAVKSALSAVENIMLKNIIPIGYYKIIVHLWICKP